MKRGMSGEWRFRIENWGEEKFQRIDDLKEENCEKMIILVLELEKDRFLVQRTNKVSVLCLKMKTAYQSQDFFTVKTPLHS